MLIPGVSSYFHDLVTYEVCEYQEAQMSWDPDLLDQINKADDLKIAPYHHDMQTTGTPTWIWEVVVENRLFVRAYSGVTSRWFKAALKQRAGRIYAAGKVYEVNFSPVSDPLLQQKIDDAYRHKYAQSSYLPSMISGRAISATVEISPKND